MKSTIIYYRCNVCGFITFMTSKPDKPMVCCGKHMTLLHMKGD